MTQPKSAVERIHNFSAGPAVLPLPVLEEVQRDLVALPGVGTLTVSAIATKDYTVIQGCVLFFGCIVVVMNLAFATLLGRCK